MVFFFRIEIAVILNQLTQPFNLHLLIVSVSNIPVYSLRTTAKKRNDLVRFNALLQVIDEGNIRNRR